MEAAIPTGAAGSHMVVVTVATVTGFRVPYRLAITPDGRTAAVVDPATGSLHLVDVASRRTTATVDVGASPRGVVFSPDGVAFHPAAPAR